MATSFDDLSLWACVVKGQLPGVKDECSACGVLLYPRQGVVLSHGSILAEQCQKDGALRSKIKSGQIILASDLLGSKFDVLIDRRWRTSYRHPDLATTKEKLAQNLVNFQQHSRQSNTFTSVKCKFVGAFRNEDFHNAVCKLMPEGSWTFTDESLDKTSLDGNHRTEKSVPDNDNFGFDLLSYFLIFRIDPQIISVSTSNSLLSVDPKTLTPPLDNTHGCRIGNTAEIVATPFANQNPSVFFNSYSRGVVCNVSGVNDCWILSDARCIPGSEGGPVFVQGEDKSRHLFAIVAASLCWKNNEWVGFSVACSLGSIISSLRQHVEGITTTLSTLPNIENVTSSRPSLLGGSEYGECDWKLTRDLENFTDKSLLSSTVVVRVGSTWGSGVIVDKGQGVILTCSHVVKGWPNSSVLIKPHGDTRHYKAKVIYSQNNKQQDRAGPFDIAVLSCVEAMSSNTDQVSGVGRPLLGQGVHIIGHALFNSDLDISPSVCSGVVSKVIEMRGKPVMVQSTCAIHAGASGGPMLNTDRKLVGIVVCNTMDKGSNSSFPHVNMSVPAISVWPPLQQYMITGDTSGFSDYNVKDPYVRKLWALDSSVISDESDKPTKSKL